MNSDSQSNNKRIAKNTLYMYLRMLVMLFVSLFTAGIVFNTLGEINYGIYNIVGSIVVFFTFLNNGLTNATRRYITAEIASGTLETQRNIFNLTIFAHLLIGVCILILAESIGLYAVNYFLNIPEDRLFAANIAYQVSVFTAVANVMQSPFTAVITANERMNIYAYFSILDVFLKLLLVAAVYYIDADKLIVYAIAMFISSFVNIVIYRCYCYMKFSMCKYTRPHNMILLKELFMFMGWNLMGQGVVVMNNQGVTILINKFFSVSANAAMGVSNQITNIVNNFIVNFQIAFNPQITKSYVKKDWEGLIQLTLRSSRFSSYLIILFLIPISFQINNFLSLWLGDYPQYAVEFCVLTLIGIYVDCFAAPLYMILGSDKNIKRYQIIVSLLYSCNFIGSWIALFMGCPPYSVIGVRIIVFAVTLVARLILTKEKVVLFPIRRWLIDVVLKSIYIMIFPISISLVLSQINYKNVFTELIIISGMSFMATCISIFFLGFTLNERKFAIEKAIAIKSKILR